MAQIWLTYGEIGEFFSCSTVTARDLAIKYNWTRHRSRDGQTRVKLPQSLMTEFISRAAAALQAFQYKSSAVMMNLEPDRGYTATLDLPAVAGHIADATEHMIVGSGGTGFTIARSKRQDCRTYAARSAGYRARQRPSGPSGAPQQQ